MPLADVGGRREHNTVFRAKQKGEPLNDATARVITIAVAVCVVLLTGYHRAAARRAARADTRAADPMADKHAEGRLIWLRAVGLLIWATLVGYFVAPERMAWSRIAAAPWLSWIGAGLAFACVLAVYWVLHHLGTNLHRGVTPQPHHHLVTTGPYRFIRHPWFAVLFLLLVALSLIWSSWLMLALALVRSAYFAARARIEDSALRAAFGAAYDDYARSVPRFLPFGRGTARPA